MKTLRMALIACVAGVFMVSLAARADEAKAVSKAAAPVVKEMKAAQPVTLTGMVKCYKDAKGTVTGGSIISENGGMHYKVAASDLQKIAAFDGQKVSVIGVDKAGALSVEKIEAVKAVEAAK